MALKIDHLVQCKAITPALLDDGTRFVPGVLKHFIIVIKTDEIRRPEAGNGRQRH
ncbi:hypothetical protein [uncultured Roseobacter sp.]|uniref:hypothetical protein n=1 Tax=uncultured Roseobacter sp. TaxID=114847 RepID=UPI002624AE55|nr:hypothetical protein [uncultured Roseobacter sp.]